MKRRLLTCGLVLLVAGCASRAPAPAPSTSPGAPRAEAPKPAAPAPKPAPLAAEQRWLSQLFEGTPVVISSDADGGVNLLVPMVHAFDGASAKPKPALKVVLDKLGQSLKRQPTSRLTIGAAGSERAQAARAHLVSRGVAAHRVAAQTAGSADGVALRLSLAPAGIGRLEDSAPAMQQRSGH
ncbi:hypothetical protein HLB44_21755 [Aquincola sp. S2]|uniref:OmpA-like domain-containing protein n=1 Tax=Pseudaquabacterium terrae TaxID=2732868 RepID=A0ABX2ELV8_9BURK|nr:hypothetical protein [Aquabacterium terrae]NRF69633.1 hypothetical protein [Aquabacterium terrae]